MSISEWISTITNKGWLSHCMNKRPGISTGLNIHFSASAVASVEDLPSFISNLLLTSSPIAVLLSIYDPSPFKACCFLYQELLLRNSKCCHLWPLTPALLFSSRNSLRQILNQAHVSPPKPFLHCFHVWVTSGINLAGAVVHAKQALHHLLHSSLQSFFFSK